jgi:hypothetical protein
MSPCGARIGAAAAGIASDASVATSVTSAERRQGRAAIHVVLR